MGREDTRIYVGNLPSDVREKDIEDIFAKYGKIRFVDIKGGRGPLYAFVEFEDYRDAEDAVRGRDGYDFDGCRIRVEFTRGVGPRGPGGRPMNPAYARDWPAPRRGGPPSRRSNFRVIVEGLPPTGSWQDLKDHLREAGDVCYADVARDGTGVAEFTRYDDMKYAVRKLDDTKFRSHEGETAYIRIREDTSAGPRSRSRSRSRSPRRSSPKYSPRRSRSRSRSPSHSPSRSRSRSHKCEVKNGVYSMEYQRGERIQQVCVNLEKKVLLLEISNDNRRIIFAFLQFKDEPVYAIEIVGRGDQLFQGSMLLRESLSLTDCPNTRFCVRQEITSSDLKTVNYLCDQATDIHGNYVVACQSEGTHSSTTSNNFPSVTMCCSSDLCNLNASNSSNSPLYRFVMVLLLLLYSFLL
ncbi:hypothetical protein ANCCAN_09552 [Ancylostoma caninum]|uniref:RRM domain-containing protein n=1 Tax=Ancylostoma caninum TaxID=29170 RepID=A0A368GN47_ANCCA|nr:hypothetical protein ANCCAN_09552 [Ancylostoma caninum]